MITVPSRRGFLPALAAAVVVAGCHAVAGVDYEIAQISSGGAPPLGQTSASTTAVSVTTSTTASQASSSSASDASSSSSGGPLGECVAPLLHVSFDVDDPATWSVLDKSGAGGRVTSPARAGDGAWQIALEQGDARGRLSWSPVAKGQEYWMGFSYWHESVEVTDGTRAFSVLCSYGAPNYEETDGFSLDIAKQTPNFPFVAAGLARDLWEATPGGVDTLSTVQHTTGTWQDWATHFKVTDGDDGFFEVFHEDDQGVWQRVFYAEGRLFDEACQPTVFLRWGLSRWQADLPPQTIGIDEIRLLRVEPSDPDPPTQADYLYTLDPDSGCGDASP